ncbi:MAG: carboxyl transferase domain-containing protein [Nitrosopumilaceae archaeon]
MLVLESRMHSEKIEEFSKRKKISSQGGGQDRIKAQHDKGKLTARERIDLLLDEGTFTEVDPLTTHHYHEYDMQKKKFFTDGVVGGYGTVYGRQIFVFAYYICTFSLDYHQFIAKTYIYEKK